MVERLAGHGVHIGASVEAGIESADGYREYKTRIEDFEGDRLVLAMPTYRGSIVPVPIGDQIQVKVPSPDKSMLFLNCEVVARQPRPIPMLVVRVVEVGQQQSRGYFRVFLNVPPLECSVWDTRGGRDEAHWRPLHATIQDLSGGGIGLLAYEPVAEGARVRTRFVLPYGGGDCRATGEVKMARPARQNGRRDGLPLIVGVEFQEITRADRERLVKAVQRFQAEERRAEVDRTAASAAGE